MIVAGAYFKPDGVPVTGSSHGIDSVLSAAGAAAVRQGIPFAVYRRLDSDSPLAEAELEAVIVPAAIWREIVRMSGVLMPSSSPASQ